MLTDYEMEGNEDFAVQLAANHPLVTVRNGAATVTILDNMGSSTTPENDGPISSTTSIHPESTPAPTAASTGACSCLPESMTSAEISKLLFDPLCFCREGEGCCDSLYNHYMYCSVSFEGHGCFC